MPVYTHEHWMMLALQEAKKAKSLGEVPVGAVIVCDDVLISEGYNRMIADNDCSAHAEIIALREAGKIIGNYRLVECDMYITLEPCMMCLGAMVHARLKSVYYATKEPKSGVMESQASFHQATFLNHKINAQGGILAQEAAMLLKDFFQKRRLEKRKKIKGTNC